MTNTHSSPANAEPLSDRLQRVIDSFDAQRQKYHNNASDPGFGEMQQEMWASLANEKADDLRVLRKLLAEPRISAQQMPTVTEEMVKRVYDAAWKIDLPLTMDEIRCLLSALTSPECGSTPKGK